MMKAFTEFTFPRQYQIAVMHIVVSRQKARSKVGLQELNAVHRLYTRLSNILTTCLACSMSYAFPSSLASRLYSKRVQDIKLKSFTTKNLLGN
jgi:hypothetical protein